MMYLRKTTHCRKNLVGLVDFCLFRAYQNLPFMKKLRTILTSFAVVAAVGGAIASKLFMDDQVTKYYAVNSIGQCVQALYINQNGCSSSGLYQCTATFIDVDDTEMVGPAYGTRPDTPPYPCVGIRLRY